MDNNAVIISDIYNVKQKYGIIYTDPPWQQKRGGIKSVRPNSSGGDIPYHTMSFEDIVNFHNTVLPKLCADKCNIFMWTIDKYLPQTEQFMKEAGYSLHARIIWDKVTGIPAAFTIRYAHEYLLWFYIKGNILKPCEEMRGKYTDVIREQVTRHSKKPEIAYKMIEDLFPDVRKIELFARNTRNGWDSWGDEL